MTALTHAGKATARWLGDLRRTGAFEESDLEELGSHLEDEIGQLVDGGLSEKEAFWVALGRVESRDDLPSEYAKTNTRAVWRHRFWWMAAGLLGYLGFSYLIRYASFEGTLLAASAGIHGVPQFVISLLLMIAVTGAALLLAWRLLSRMGASTAGSRFQTVRRSWKGTALLYLLCVGAAVFLIGLGLFGWRWIPLGGPEVNIDHYAEAREVFAALLAVSLVSAAFWASRPAKAPAAAASRPAQRESQGGTRRYLWAIIAAVCLMAPLAAAAAIFVPGLLYGGPEAPMAPAHWWQVEMTEEQLATLSASWGKPATAAELLEEVCPGVLEEMPEEARIVYEQQGIYWPSEGYEAWDGSSFMCAGGGVAQDEAQCVYSYYVGSRGWEEGTLVMNTDMGFAEDRLYRVSLYVGGQPE